jgi:uncharacterized protein YceH (UPF0502 family)
LPTTFPFGVPLDPVQLRVLGALIEKEIATPEQYPLSLNALINACNQRSSREPVMDLSEGEVRDALGTLEEHALVYLLRDTRVTKYEHRIRTVLNLRRDETAVMCLLLLRGAQTPGELRSRADRLYSFDDLAAVQATLERLASRSAAADGGPSNALHTTPLVLLLPRPPGAREARYIHLLGEAVIRPTTSGGEIPAGAASGGIPDRIVQLEGEIFVLKEQVSSLLERIQRLEGESLTALR